MRRNSDFGGRGTTRYGRVALYVAGGYVAYKAAQGGLFGLPLQALTTTIGQAGGLVSTGTTDALQKAFGRTSVVDRPGGAPNTTAGSTSTGANRQALPAPGRSVDLGAEDPAAAGFAWDSTGAVLTIRERTVIGHADTKSDAVLIARAWYAANG